MGIEKEERVWCTYKVCYLKQHKTKTKTSGHLAIILQRLLWMLSITVNSFMIY